MGTFYMLVGFSVAISIFHTLNSFIDVQNDQFSSTSWHFKRFYSISTNFQKRQTPNYVLLPTNYTYDDLDINLSTSLEFGTGSSRKTIKLKLTPQHVTWVPRLPESQTEFCNNQKYENECRFAGNSWYSPRAANRRTENNNFTFSETVDYNSTYGDWYEDTVTGGGASVSLQFGVAEHWRSAPALGLGVQDGNPNPERPNYLTALSQQARIGSQTCSFYNILDSDSPGEVIIGGVNRGNIFGKFQIWDNYDTGLLDTPMFRLVGGNNTANATVIEGPYKPPGAANRPAWIEIKEANIRLPSRVHEWITTTLNASRTDIGYYMPCNHQFDREAVLEIIWSEVTIRIPLTYITSPPTIARNVRDDNMCFVNLGDPPGESEYSCILGGPFFRAAYVVLAPADSFTAIAASKQNATSQDIVPLSGNVVAMLQSVSGSDAPMDSSNPESPPGASIPNTGQKSLSTGAIAGIAIGGAAVVLGGIGALIFLCIRRRRKWKTPPVIPLPEPGLEPLYGSDQDPTYRPISELSASFKHASNTSTPPMELPGSLDREPLTGRIQ
ncbi:hypothetical protein H072_826 [Dactylellina haptotyla CBS 200.50]|uniref:Peptidase A1 domain-containing protein n=1 Tax=Dactylellina haptotyla (strain CBS 200.50) TaxID=1284197 RepID=S8CBT4_DACHA|nr:hypothetical protein H072_826 [Dactylellina haptotyla CBS 200.50]